MSKAFDRVRHNVLVSDLQCLGISGQALTWCIDYLSSRQQRVVVGNEYSKYTACSRGVPQGSVLGPLLFSIYIKDISSCVSPEATHQEFADDITVEHADRDAGDAADRLSSDLSALSLWLDSRGLVLNERKTSVMFIGPRGIRNSNDLPTVWCHNSRLPTCDQVRYLGLTIDHDLTWSAHVLHLKQKVRPAVGALWRSRHALTLRAKRLYYTAMIQSQLTYCSNAFFPGCSAGAKKQLQTFANMAIRSLMPHDYRQHVPMESLLATMRIEYIDAVCSRKVCRLVHRCIYRHPSRTVSPLLSSFFSVVNSGRTRGSAQNLLTIPFSRGPAGRTTVQFLGAIAWNSLPPFVRDIQDVTAFNQALSQQSVSLGCLSQQ